MRGNLFRVLLAVVTVLVAGAGAAQAAPVDGRYHGYGGPVPSLGCDAATISGLMTPTGYFGHIDDAAFLGCGWGFGEADVRAQLPWTVHPIAQTTGTVDYLISDVHVDVSGPFCEATVVGQAYASYDIATGVLTVDGGGTTVTYVDPANDCLGLIAEGEAFPVLPYSYDMVIPV